MDHDASKRKETVPQWMVIDPYAKEGEHTFESPGLALLYAASVARSDRPTFVVDPAGADVVVMVVDPRVTLQAVRHLTGPHSGGPSMPSDPAEASVQALAGARLFYALYHDADLVMYGGHRDRSGKAVAFNKAYTSAQNAFLPEGERGKPIRDVDGFRHDGAHMVTVAPSGIPTTPPPSFHTCDEKAGAVIVGLGDVTRCGCGMDMPNVRGVLNAPDVQIAPHVHTSQTGVGFDSTCEGCRQIENARRPTPFDADGVAAYRKGYDDAERELGDRVPTDVIRSLVAQGRREAAEAIREQARMFGVESKTEGEPGTMLSFVVAAQLAEGTTGVQDGTS